MLTALQKLPRSKSCPELVSRWVSGHRLRSALFRDCTMDDQGTEKLLTQINARLNARQYAGWVLFGGVLLLMRASVINIRLALLVALLCGVVVHCARRADRRRRTFVMPYDVTAMSHRQWQAVTEAFSALAESQKVWLIHDGISTADGNKNAGATQGLSRSDVSILKTVPPFIATNVTPLCLNLGTQQVYFLPDRVYIYRSRKYAAVSYDTITMEAGITDCIETGRLPSDAQQVGQTWHYVNKDGSPDRRFSHNRSVPIVRYGVVQIVLSDDVRLTLYVSLAQAAQSAVAAFHQAPPPCSPEPELVQDCYTILGLSRSCTREEASAAYRQLAKHYHPDMVSHLAPEFQRMAEEKMKEFNKAYMEVKRLRGW